MVCLSHKGTSILIKTLSEDYNVDVQLWADKLQERISVCQVNTSLLLNIAFILLCAQLTDFEFNYQRSDVFGDEQLDDDNDEQLDDDDDDNDEQLDDDNDDNVSEGRRGDDSAESDVDDENDCCSGNEQNCDLEIADSGEEFYECTEGNDDDDDDDDDYISVIAPPHSPISDVDLGDDFEEHNFDENVLQDDVPPDNYSILSVRSPRETEHRPVPTWCGYKLIIDNVDKNIRPYFQRVDRQTRSLHYCHTLAIKDRIDRSDFSDVSCNDTVQYSDILPNAQDLNLLKKSFKYSYVG